MLSSSKLDHAFKACIHKLRKLFPKSPTLHGMSKRNKEPFLVNRTLTERYLNSAVSQMQRLLNCYQKKQNETLRQLTMSVNRMDDRQSTSALKKFWPFLVEFEKKIWVNSTNWTINCKVHQKHFIDESLLLDLPNFWSYNSRHDIAWVAKHLQDKDQYRCHQKS